MSICCKKSIIDKVVKCSQKFIYEAKEDINLPKVDSIWPKVSIP